jgi:hypothetical protein
LTTDNAHVNVKRKTDNGHFLKEMFMESKDINLKELIMGTEEAAELWGVTQDHVKKLCRQGKCNAILIGKSWALLRGQDKPLKKSKRDGE